MRRVWILIALISCLTSLRVNAQSGVLLADINTPKPPISKSLSNTNQTLKGNITTTLKKISLADAIKIGASSNLDIQRTKLNIDIAKNNVKVANRLQNPQLNTFFNLGSAGRGNPQQFGASENIELFKRGARKKLAKSNLELTKEDVASVHFNMRMDIRESYVNLVSAKSLEKSLEEQQNLLKDLLYIAQKRFEAGATPEMDVIQARLALNQMVTQVNTAKVNVKAARYDFNRALNIKSDKVLYDTQEETLPEGKSFVGMAVPLPTKKMPEFDNILNSALNERSDVKIAKQQIDVAQKNLIDVKRKLIPDLALTGGYSYMSAGAAGTDQHLNGAYAGVSLIDIPIFYAYRPEIKNAKLQIEQAKLNYDSVQNKAVQSLNEAYEKFVTAQVNLNYYNNKLLKDSNEMIRISKRSYQVGKSNLTSLIVMEQSYRSIIIGYTQALSDYYDCWIDFIREVSNEEFKINEENI